MIRQNDITYRQPVALLAIALLFILMQNSAAAQTTSNPLDSTTPAGLAPGAPVGAYALSGFETVNLYSGSLNFQLPLLQAGGRGTAGVPLMLVLNQKWTMDRIECPGCIPGLFYVPNDESWSTFYNKPKNRIYMRFGLTGRGIASDLQHCYDPPLTDYYSYGQTLTRLTFTAPDGTEYEMYDKLNNGAINYIPLCPGQLYLPSMAPRGKVFATKDGSAATFISDAPIADHYFDPGVFESGNPPLTGDIFLRDGTRYRIVWGKITLIRDHNGNLTKLEYGTNPSDPGYQMLIKITDSMNRVVNLAYDVTEAPYGLHDKITWKGANGVTRTLRISIDTLSNRLRNNPGDPTQPWTYAQLFPMLSTSTPVHNPSVISAVWLPDGRSYQFRYNVYGELAQVTLPTAGITEYDWGGGFGNPAQTGEFDNGSYAGLYRRVSQRRVFTASGVMEGKTDYTPSHYSQQVGGFTYFYTQVNVYQRKPDGTLLAEDHHTFNHQPYLYPVTTPAPWGDPFAQSSLTEGKEILTEQYDTSGVLLRKVQNTWVQGTGGVQITDTTTTLADVSPNLVTKQTFAYDQYNNPTDTWEYDYGSGVPGSLKRHTRTQYLTSGYDTVSGTSTNPNASATIHIRSLPTSQAIYTDSGTANKVAESTYEYDNYTPDTYHVALLGRTGISGMCDGGSGCANNPNFTSTTYTTRGNATKVSRWLNTTGGTLNTYAQYDVAGNVVKAFDGRGNATDFDFTDRFGGPNGEARANTAPTELGAQSSFALATKVQAPSVSSLRLTTYTQFDYYLGRAVDSEDPNGVVSSVVFSTDALDRPTQVIRANTASPADPKKNQTTFTYNDASHLITTTSDHTSFNDTQPLKSEALYDGLARTSEKRAYETSTTYITVKTNYDALSRAYQVSNPYRSGDTVLWTTTAYDALSRVVSVTTPDGAAVATYYSGNKVLAKDQVGKERMSQTDGLGQLTDVWEITAADSATESVSFPSHSEVMAGYRTKYVYDALSDLTTATQQIGTSGTTQTRSFVYDSLKRLTSATNPESGAMTYQYDGNGNLTSKTDARNVTTTINYDAVNRPTSKTYSDGTPAIAYFYDNQTLPTGAPSYSRGSSIGRQVAVTYDGGSQGSYYGYDTLGRVPVKYQRISATNYQVQAGYNLAGAMTSETYPSGRMVSYSFDTAGRLNTFSGTLGDGLSRTYASITQYNAAGLKERESYGTGTNGMTTPLYLKLHYNKRQQMVDLRLGSVNDEWNWNRGSLIFYYGTNAVSYWNQFWDDTDNNGNVRRALNYVPTVVDGSGNVTTYVIPELQDYTYDTLNRIGGVTEAQMNAAGAWTFNVVSQTFGYDRYGNRGITAASGGVNNYNPAYNASNNRITTVSYDAAGNITSDGLTGGTMTYDAENRLKTATNGGGGVYTYDGNGKRVTRMIAGQYCWYVYGLGGELLAEYLSTGPTTVKKEYGYRGGQMLVVWDGALTGDQAWKWLVTDHLGSTRMEADKSGSLTGMKRHDYLPFGEELTASVGAQRNGVGYEPPASNVRQKFDGYERDSESGLDYAQARYFASTQGRFTGPDAPFADQDEEDPQSWNLYAYTRNNPLNAIDPSGRETCFYQNGKLVGCDNEKGVSIDNKNGILITPKQSYKLSQLDAQVVVSAHNITSAHGVPYASPSFFVSRERPGQCFICPTGPPPPPIIPIVSGFLDWYHSPIGQVQMAVLPIPGGAIASVLGKLGLAARVGKGIGVIEVVGDVNKAKAFFDELRGANAVRQVAQGVEVAESATGVGNVTFRAVSSKGGPPTVDVHGIEQGIKKIKFVAQ